MIRRRDSRGWTISTLVEHFDRVLAEQDRRYEERFEAQQEATKLALDAYNREFHEHLRQVESETRATLAASEKAIAKAEASIDRRLEGVNEFRQTLADQAGQFVTKAEYQAHRTTIEERVATNTSRLNKMEGRSGGITAGWGYLVGAAGMMAAVAAVVASLAR